MPSTNMTLLQLEPEDKLSFSQSSDSPAPKRTLRLTNKTGSQVAFKVKTTAPKAYLVRPSSATLGPKESAEVQIILQMQGSGGCDPSEINNHRFLVQAVAVDHEETISRDQWQAIDKDTIQEQRLSVVLEEQEDDVAGAAAGATNAANEAARGRPQLSAAAESPDQLKVAYEELVQYVLDMEKQKTALEAEKKRLLSERDTSMVSGDRAGWSSQCVVMTAVLTVLLAYLANMMGEGGAAGSPTLK